MEGCSLGEKNAEKINVMNNELIKVITNTSNNKEVLQSQDVRISKVEQTHSMFLSVQKDISNINEKIDNSINESKRNTDVVTKALINRTKIRETPKEKFINAMITAGGYFTISVAAWVFFKFMLEGGTI